MRGITVRLFWLVNSSNEYIAFIMLVIVSHPSFITCFIAL